MSVNVVVVTEGITGVLPGCESSFLQAAKKSRKMMHNFPVKIRKIDFLIIVVLVVR